MNPQDPPTAQYGSPRDYDQNQNYARNVAIIILVVLTLFLSVALLTSGGSPSPRTVVCTQLQKTERDIANTQSASVMYNDGYQLGIDAKKAGGVYLADIQEFVSASQSGVDFSVNPGLVQLQTDCR